ncbi:hypothetical protein EJ06DRAFT_284150 [Trichodelitschia bisporula]|uniref:Uncharacterized protein n=1 Tax=Trichodelitschia bisporula TaxID=703511 RepID=A0A6G1I6C1_9PEZI|nr:hypothetical protein EJ06DRAFT_284150 [Trichodelitschia bisporula]
MRNWLRLEIECDRGEKRRLLITEGDTPSTVRYCIPQFLPPADPTPLGQLFRTGQNRSYPLRTSPGILHERRRYGKAVPWGKIHKISHPFPFCPCRSKPHGLPIIATPASPCIRIVMPRTMGSVCPLFVSRVLPRVAQPRTARILRISWGAKKSGLTNAEWIDLKAVMAAWEGGPVCWAGSVSQWSATPHCRIVPLPLAAASPAL